MPKKRGHLDSTQPVTHARPSFPQGGARIAISPEDRDKVRIIDGETGEKLPWNTNIRVTGTKRGMS